MRLADVSAATVGVVLCLGCSQKQKEEHQIDTAAFRPAWMAPSTAASSFALSTETTLGELAAPAAISVRGHVRIDVRTVDDAVQLLLEPWGVALVEPKGAEVAAAKTLTDEFERPFGVELTEGAISAYLDTIEISPLAFGLRRQLVAGLQLHRPRGVAGNSWLGREWDATGAASTRYRMNSDQPGIVLWEKIEYLQTISQSTIEGALDVTQWKPKVVQSSGTIRFDAAGLVSVMREEALRADLTPESALKTASRIRVERLRTLAEPAGTQQNRWMRELRRRASGEPPPPIQSDALDMLRVAGRSLDEVLKSLEALPAGVAHEEAAFRKRQGDFQALVGLVRIDPKNVEGALNAVRAGSPASETILKALGAASSKAASARLADLALDGTMSSSVRRMAAASLLRAEGPDSGLFEVLEKFLGDRLLAEMGLLGFGTFARRWGKQGNQEVAQQAVALLGKELEKAASPTRRAMVLLAIANSGAAELFDAVVPHQAAEETPVREAAIQAIRLMPHPGVERRLVELLDRAESRFETVAVLTALSKRTAVSESTARRVQNLTAPTEAPEVRREAVLTLLAWSKQWPDLQDVLRSLAESDEDPRVREVAKEAVPN
jgi:hypothetical protein